MRVGTYTSESCGNKIYKQTTGLMFGLGNNMRFNIDDEEKENT